jgi:hypothetical protein
METVSVLGIPNSESTQQDRADEDDDGAYRQYIEPYGKVHEQPPS